MSLKGRMTLVVSALVAMVAPVAMALDEVEVSVSADYYSKYVWRGQELFDGSVFQPGVGLAKGNWSVGFWGSMQMESDSAGDNSGEFTEVDYSIDYTDTVPGAEMLSYSIGGILYDFPNTAFVSTFEVYAGLAWDTLLSPSLTVYQDVKSDGTYISLAAGHTLELTEEVAVDLGASLGWGSDKYSEAYWSSYTTSSALNDLAFSASLPLAIGDVSVVPAVGYVLIMDSDIDDGLTAAGADSDFFYAGVSLSMSF